MLQKQLVLAFVLGVLSSCGPNDQNSDRDTKREQIRTNAKSKEKELASVVGSYLGSLSEQGLNAQDALLTLLIKEEVQTPEMDVDPIRVPRLSGYLRLGYASNEGSQSNITFSVTKGEYDAKIGVINLDLQNKEFGSLTLELDKKEDGLLGGIWVAKESSLDGKIALKVIPDGVSLISSGFKTTPLDGQYGGFLLRSKDKTFYNAKLIFQSKKKGNDSVDVKASLSINFGPWSSSEVQVYTFSEVVFNPINGTVSMASRDNTISLSGSLSQGLFQGEWTSSYTGKEGGFAFTFGNFSKPDQETFIQETSISEQYLGILQHRKDAGISFPENVMLSLSMREDLQAPNRSRISGSLRFYAGSYQSQEYVEVPIGSVSFNPFTRAIIIRTSQPYSMTISGKLRNGVLSASFHFGSKGYFADAQLKIGSTVSTQTDMQGNYQAIFTREEDQSYQLANMQLFTSYDKSLRISGNLKLIFGDWHSSEYLSYRFGNISFNPENSVLTIADEDSEVFIKARYKNGKILGQWHSKSLGEMGTVSIRKIEKPRVPDEYVLQKGIAGEYKGQIIDTNPNTSLPEGTLLTLVTSRDLSSQDGIKIQGKLRLYLGEIGSHEYMEYPLEEIRHNFFTREFRATAKGLGVSINGKIRNQKLTGKIDHDGFGNIGTIEVKVD